MRTRTKGAESLGCQIDSNSRHKKEALSAFVCYCGVGRKKRDIYISVKLESDL